jgi:hypothetical protein
MMHFRGVAATVVGGVAAMCMFAGRFSLLSRGRVKSDRAIPARKSRVGRLLRQGGTSGVPVHEAPQP